MGPCTSWNPSQCQFQRAGLSWFIQPHFPTYMLHCINTCLYSWVETHQGPNHPKSIPKHIKPQIIQTSSNNPNIISPCPDFPSSHRASRTSPAAPVSAARGWHRSSPRSAASPAWPVRRPHCACGRRSGPCHRPGASASWVGPGRTSGPGWRAKGDPGEEGKIPWGWWVMFIVTIVNMNGNHNWSWLRMIDYDW